jgi:hypothetical protein
MPKSLPDQLRAAIAESGLSLNSIATGAEIDYAALHKFYNNEDRGLRMDTASRLVAFLGLELKPKAKPVKRAKKA